MCLQILGWQTTASSKGGGKSFGCGDVNLTRSIPGMSATAVKRRAKSQSPESVGIDVLAQKRDLLEAFTGDTGGFVENTVRISRPFTPARIGNHTETAEVVAAAHDGDPGVDAWNARGNDVIVCLILGQIHGQGFQMLILFLGMNRIANQPRQLTIGVWAGQQIDQRLLLGELLLEILCHAAQDTNDQGPASFESLEVGQMRVHLRVGVFANGTGIHENHIGGFPIFGHDIPFAHEQGSNELGVILVHLTTERFDVHLATVTGLNDS